MNGLKKMFFPESIAVIGASRNPRKIGYELLSNLLAGGFEGRIYPVNPEGSDVMGLRSYPSIKSVPTEVDLALIAIPAAYVADILEECGEKGVKAALVISSGFREVGNDELELKILSIAKRHGIRILGPNIFGLYYAPSRMNATFGLSRVLPGKIAFITQSGALGIAMMGWTTLYRVGVSAVVSMGNKADIEESDVIDFFAEDDNTKAVLMYMEGAKDGKRLLASIKGISAKKPLVVLKSGRTEKGASAAASHTGSIAGSDRIYDAAFKQGGALRAADFAEAFDWAKLMTFQPPPSNDNCLIITNGGGVGVMATDACDAAGINVWQLPEDLQSEFKKQMPVFGSSKNPVDLTGQAYEESYYRSVDLALREERIGSLMVLYCQTAITDPVSIAKSIIDACETQRCQKTVVTSFIGGSQCDDAMKKLEERGIPAYAVPERAVSSLSAYYRWQRYLLRIKRPVADEKI